jgi:hypothetical protein
MHLTVDLTQVEKAVALLRTAGILIEGDPKVSFEQIDVSQVGGPPEFIQIVRCRLTFIVEATPVEAKSIYL